MRSLQPAKREMTTQDIEKFRAEWRRFIEHAIRADFVKPVSVVNNGYLHTFNASFDGLFLREQNSPSLLAANQPMRFGTIQPCIRTEDKLSLKHSSLHLGLFDICGFSVLDFSTVTAGDMAEDTIKEFLLFYCDYLKLEKKLLRIYYFGGSTLRSISSGKIDSDEYIEPDMFSVDIWRRHGLDGSQLISDSTSETFLLHLGNPLREHHSGYRNDIFIESQNANYEIGTLNFISHQTVIEDGAIIGIKPLAFYLREMAIGQERFVAAQNGMTDLFELPYLRPLLNAVTIQIADSKIARIYIDALRVIHYFFSDGWTYNKLQGKRYREHRNELNRFMQLITRLGHERTEDDLTDVLILNAQLQPWYPKLGTGIDATLSEIAAYKSRSVLTEKAHT